MRGLAREESNELNGCQYLDRVSVKKDAGIEEDTLRFKPLFLEGGTTGKISILILHWAPQIAAPSRRPRRTDVREFLVLGG